jgi:hypothetical protein
MPLFKPKDAYNSGDPAAPKPKEPRAPTSAQDWQEVIAELQQKIDTARQELTELEAEQASMSLDSELGSKEAQLRVAQLTKEIAKLQSSAGITLAAVVHANARLQEDQAREAQEKETQRRQAIQAGMREYMTAVRTIDQNLMNLCHSFTQAKEILQRATGLMTLTERPPFTQLQTLWGATLAAAHFGLGEFISLGPEAQHHRHRQSLEDYTATFTGSTYGWLESPPPNPQPSKGPQYLT